MSGSGELDVFNDFLKRIQQLPIDSKYLSMAHQPSSSNSVLSAPIPSATHFTIVFKPLKGESKQVRLPSNSKVGDLRQLANESFPSTTNNDPGRLRLIQSGKALHDDNCLLENVLGGATSEPFVIHVLEKPKPKPPRESDSQDKPANFEPSKLSTAFWVKFDELLQNEGLVSDLTLRSKISEYLKNFKS